MARDVAPVVAPALDGWPSTTSVTCPTAAASAPALAARTACAFAARAVTARGSKMGADTPEERASAPTVAAAVDAPLRAPSPASEEMGEGPHPGSRSDGSVASFRCGLGGRINFHSFAYERRLHRPHLNHGGLRRLHSLSCKRHIELADAKHSEGATPWNRPDTVFRQSCPRRRRGHGGGFGCSPFHHSSGGHLDPSFQQMNVRGNCRP